MFDMDQNQKVELVNILQLKLSIVNFKIKSIKANFKNMRKYSISKYCYHWPDLENLTMSEIINLEHRYDDDCRYLKSVSKKNKIELFEDQDINYFIQHYNISFEKENKPFLIEI
jgi:hypothetical protein